jgi:hypothetical protein
VFPLKVVTDKLKSIWDKCEDEASRFVSKKMQIIMLGRYAYVGKGGDTDAAKDVLAKAMGVQKKILPHLRKSAPMPWSPSYYRVNSFQDEEYSEIYH